MTTRPLLALGIGQCVNWGVLYYAFAVLVVPLERELSVPTWVVTGAFSLALLMSATLAPRVGRWCDRGRGPIVMQAGGFIAAALMIAWLFLPGVFGLYVVWAGLGLCMAAVLYEPAFVIVGRTHQHPSARLRALAVVTVFGGLASTVFLPLTAFLATSGWRVTVLCLAAILALSTWITGRIAFRDLPYGHLPSHAEAAPRPQTAMAGGFSFVGVVIAFTLATLASAALTTNLIPALRERGVPPATAALLGGLMGAMQVPGRALLMNGTLAGSPPSLLLISLVLHATGLVVIALASSTAAMATGATIFAIGAGLITIVRPYLIQSVFHIERAGDVTGRVARYQQLARAAGPVVVALLASRFTYGSVFATLAVSFVAVTLAVPTVLAEPSGPMTEGDDMTKQETNERAAQTPAPACCDSTTLQTCCGSETKENCCGADTAPKVCGCSASRTAGSAVSG